MENLDSMAQNRPILIARDFAALGVPIETTFSILLNRGVFKWLAARRQIIRLKDELKREIQRLQEDAQSATGAAKKLALVRMNTISQVRERIRKICHSPRLQAPDDDRHAIKFVQDVILRKHGATQCGKKERKSQ